MAKTKKNAIHPTAVVSPDAEISNDVNIGPYSVISGEVRIGEGTTVGPHTVIEGPTVIGRNNCITGQSAIGTDPQDLKYRGEESSLYIGNDNIIREYVTVNRGTKGGGSKTSILDGNLLMTGVHIAHDCSVGNGTILANSATLAGHVEVADFSIVGAFCGIHQFCRVGDYAFVGGYSVLTRDALPFIKTVGQRNKSKLYGINSLGLRRKGFSNSRINILKRAYRCFFNKELTLRDAIEKIRKGGLDSEDVKLLIRFIETAKRGFVREIGDKDLKNKKARSDCR